MPKRSLSIMLPVVWVALSTVTSCAQIPDGEIAQAISEQEKSAMELVAERTAAYNAHDIDAFAAVYHPDVRIYEYPDHFLGAGVERMKTIFGPQFEAGDGKIVVHRRFALEGTVISDETVTIGEHVEKNIGIYTVVDGKIVEVRLIEPIE